MLSDGVPLGVPVARLSCRHCGSAALPPASRRRLPQRIFSGRYSLNAGPPSAADRLRQQGYAERIRRLCPLPAPRSILDIGCGNGALLLALGECWPGTRLQGVEPAPGAAAAGRQAGLAIAPALSPGMRAALVVSVNVIEHTEEPLGFLRALRRAVAPGGVAVVICPDGARPWLELLMADHRWSLTPVALAGLAARAGFQVLAAEPAPEGGFQAIVLRPAPPRRVPPRHRPPPGLAAARRRYLGAWRALEAELLARATPGRRLVCFGTGEAARLLRAYAPALWSRVAAVTADDPAGAEGLGKPLIPPASLGPEDALLLAVRPQAQPVLAARLAGAGLRPLRWDDRVPR
jgi:SAM-dependent methyltransferase